MEVIAEPKARRPRQLRLFQVTNPLSERLGDPFFRALPRQPGVYFFYDETDRLLYIGQSNNLRARVGSYRHVNFERHARRTLRLVHRVRRIEWEICESMAAAIERERVLLLERRPPFNRAGVWQAPPWWLQMELRESIVDLSLQRETGVTSGAPAAEVEAGTPVMTLRFGPYRASFPFVYAALVRALSRQIRQDLQLVDFPAGHLSHRMVGEVRLRGATSTAALAEMLTAFLTGQGGPLLPEVVTEEAPPAGTNLEDQFWMADAELLRDFYERQTFSRSVQ